MNNKNRMLQNLLILIAAFYFIGFNTGCRNRDAVEKRDTPTSGEIKIVTDESFAPLIKDEVNTFSMVYKEAKINVILLPEIDAVNTFFSDPEMRLMIIPRLLSENEKKYFTQIGLPSHEIKVAIDAIVFIVNKQNPDSNLLFSQVEDIISGESLSWKQINSKSGLGEIVLVFDNQKSSTVRYLKDQVLKNRTLTKNAFAVDSSMAVVDYVNKNANAIGVIASGWIGNVEDSLTRIHSGVKIVGVSARDSSDRFYLPTKRFIYSLKYPFLRELYVISQEKYAGLGTGFANYLASDEGQRVVQRSGLLPVDNAVRIIELRDSF
jgi:phosphate transport system substrate-binding protein